MDGDKNMKILKVIFEIIIFGLYFAFFYILSNTIYLALIMSIIIYFLQNLTLNYIKKLGSE